MKKEIFVKAIDDLEKQYLKDVEKAKKLSEYVPEAGFEYLIYDNHLVNNALLSVLSCAMEDVDEWIEYYCFELDFGKENYRLKVRDTNNVEIPLSNSGELYDFLKQNNKTSHL